MAHYAGEIFTGCTMAMLAMAYCIQLQRRDIQKQQKDNEATRKVLAPADRM